MSGLASWVAGRFQVETQGPRGKSQEEIRTWKTHSFTFVGKGRKLWKRRMSLTLENETLSSSFIVS